MNNNSYEILNLRKTELLQLAEAQLKIAQEVDGENNSGGLTPSEKIRGVVERLKSEHFNLLVMGCFSSGKSTFLNALIGEKLLPSSALPCTGVLTFLKYADSENQKIVLYKKGVSVPEEFQGCDLKNILKESVKIAKDCENKEEASSASPYEKAEVFYPLSFCKDGVEIIDSVGLNDPAARDKITEDYAKSADAIVYCMNCQNAKTMKDLETILWLSKLGFKNIFIVLTYYDCLVSNCSDDDESIVEVERKLKKSLSDKTALGEKAIFFVDSRGALRGDLKALDLLQAVKQGLEIFLVSEKGLSQLRGNVTLLALTNKELTDRIAERNIMLSKNSTEIEEKIKKAKIPLENRRKEVVGVLEELNADSEDIIQRIRTRIDGFVNSLEFKVRNFVNTYEFVNDDFEKQKKEICEETKKYLENTCVDFQQSLESEITPDLNRLQRHLKRNFDEFSAKINELKSDIGLDSVLSNSNSADIGVGETFTLGLGGGVLSAVLGLGMIGGFILAPLAIFGYGFLKEYFATKKLREEFSNAISSQLRDFSPKFCEEVCCSYQKRLEKINEIAKREFTSQIEAIEGDLQKTLDAHNGDKNKLNETIELFKKLKVDNEKLALELKSFFSLIG